MPTSDNDDYVIELSEHNKIILKERVDGLLEDYVFINFLTKEQQIEVVDLVIKSLEQASQAAQVNDLRIPYLDKLLLWDDCVLSLMQIAVHPCPQNRNVGSPYIGYGSDGIERDIDGNVYVYSIPFGTLGGIVKEQRGLLSFSSDYPSKDEKLKQIIRCHPGQEAADDKGFNLKFDGLIADPINPALKQAIISFISNSLIEFKNNLLESVENSQGKERQNSALYWLMCKVSDTSNVSHMEALDKLQQLTLDCIEINIRDALEKSESQPQIYQMLNFLKAIVSYDQDFLEDVLKIGYLNLFDTVIPWTLVRSESEFNILLQGLKQYTSKWNNHTYIENLRWQAERGIVERQFDCAKFLEKNGRISEAIHYYILAAEQGDMMASFRLGSIFDDVDKDKKKAALWYKLASIQGHALAPFHLGLVFYEGSYDVEKNYNEARKCFELVAKQGYLKAQFYLGLIFYEGGYGIEKNYNEAIRWLQEASIEGHTEAQFYLGEFFHNGDCGVEKNYKEALRLFKLAANQGHVEAQYNLGLIFYKGECGVEQNYEEALKWFKLAAEKGYVKAQFQLGLIFYNGGCGIEKNYGEALKWFKLAANQGDVVAQYNVGTLFYKWFKNYKEAVKWHERAAEQGYVEAQFQVGLIFYNGGCGVERNYEEALKWFKLAAEQGHVEAQHNLGALFYNGSGVEKNYEEALKWFKLAADQGGEKKKKFLKELEYNHCLLFSSGVINGYGCLIPEEFGFNTKEQKTVRRCDSDITLKLSS